MTAVRPDPRGSFEETRVRTDPVLDISKALLRPWSRASVSRERACAWAPVMDITEDRRAR
jgi:hypothetical protein